MSELCKHGVRDLVTNLPYCRRCDAEAKSELAPVSCPGECEESVIRKIRQRRDVGRLKYGTSMERTDLTRLDWLRHAQEEAIDFAIYLEKLIQTEQQNAPDQRPGA